MKTPTKIALAIACLSLIALPVTADAMNPSTSTAMAASANAHSVAKKAGFAIIDFEVQSEDIVITPFGADVEMDEAHAKELNALSSELDECINDCVKTSNSQDEYNRCINNCIVLFGND